jgi:branched-chain amino acid transport system permease protein
MFGAFTVYVAIFVLGLPYVAAAVLAFVVLFMLGVLIERGLMRPVRFPTHIKLVMMTVALSYLLRGVARLYWGREILGLPQIYSYPPIEFSGVVVTTQDLITSSVVMTLVLVFFILFHKTKWGKVAQAASQTPRGAALVGINVPTFRAVMWGVAALMAAIAAILVAPITLLYPDMGGEVLIRAFAGMVLGGFGSLIGAVVGGLSVGVLEQFTGGYISTALIDISALLVIFVVLLTRPNGLFGKAEVSRV